MKKEPFILGVVADPNRFGVAVIRNDCRTWNCLQELLTAWVAFWLCSVGRKCRPMACRPRLSMAWASDSSSHSHTVTYMTEILSTVT